MGIFWNNENISHCTDSLTMFYFEIIVAQKVTKPVYLQSRDANMSISKLGKQVQFFVGSVFNT